MSIGQKGVGKCSCLKWRMVGIVKIARGRVELLREFLIGMVVLPCHSCTISGHRFAMVYSGHAVGQQGIAHVIDGVVAVGIDRIEVGKL